MIVVATREEIKRHVCPACDGRGNPKKMIGIGPDGRQDWVPLVPDPPDRGSLDYRRCGWCFGKGMLTTERYNEARFLVAQRMLVSGDP